MGDTVFRLALCRVGNRTDAEDVAQTVFMKLCQSTEPIKDSKHLKAWLLRVTLTSAPTRIATLGKRVRQQARKHRSLSRTLRSNATASHPATPTTHRTKPSSEAWLQPFPNGNALPCIFTISRVIRPTRSHNHRRDPATVRSHLHRARASLKLKMGVFL